jgi:formate C-acetyltransferase
VAEKKGLTESAIACRKAASGTPDTLHSALQLVWSIEFIFCAYISHNPTLTIGRLDLFLNEIYEKELASGSIDKDRARLLIDEFYAKNNLIMGRGEHQVGDENNSTTFKRILNFDAPQYLLLAGRDSDGNVTVNELTQLFAECIVPSFKNPVIVVRYVKNMDSDYPKLWKSGTKNSLDSSCRVYT